MDKVDKPKYTRLKIKCDCILGSRPKMAVFNNMRSTVRTKETLVSCTYYCQNCTAVWKAEWFFRNGAWNTKPIVKKVKDRKHA